MSPRRREGAARGGALSQAVLVLSLMLAAGILAERDWLWRWDNILYDASLPLLSSSTLESIVIVAVDEESLSRLGRWPWSRRVHAELVTRLVAAGARVILLDMIFSEPDLGDPGADQALARALRDSGRGVLPVLLEQPQAGGQLLEQMPIPVLADAAARLGHAHAELDADGLARSTYLMEGLGSPRWPALALAMMWVGDREAVPDLADLEAAVAGDSVSRAWIRAHHVLVPFLGRPGSVPRVSYADVLEGSHPAQAFRDAYVLVGVTATGLGDILPTPVSGHSHPMPGVEFNANLLNALSGEGVVYRLAQTWRIGICALLAGLPVLLFARLGPRSALLLTVAMAVAVVLGAALLLMMARVWVAPAPALVAVLASYPLWSWLRLESAMRFLRRELGRARSQSEAIALAPQAPLACAVKQLVELLSVSDWSLRDEAATPVLARGELDPGGAGALVPGQWRRRRGLLQLGLWDQGRTYQLFARWEGDAAPAAFHARLMDSFVDRYSPERDAAPTDSVEVVQAHIDRLLEANDRLQALRGLIDDALAQMADAVLVTDGLGQVRLANLRASEYLLDHPGEVVVGTVLADTLAHCRAEGEQDWTGALRQVMTTGQEAVVTARHDGGRDLLFRMAPIQTGGIISGGVIVTASDISQFKDRERRREEMLSFLSHDLRSPLISLLAVLELERAQHGASPEGFPIDQVESYTRTTLHLAEQFLELVRAESQEELASHEFDMLAVASNALDQVWAQASARDVRIARHFHVDEAWLSGDSGLIERAIVNLLSNAVAHNPPGTRVELEVGCVGECLRLVVRDDGAGIPKRAQAQVFQRFERGGRHDHADDHRAGGSGLGLAFVDVVCKRHGAQVNLTSAEGEGSCFTLTFHGCDCGPT